MQIENPPQPNPDIRVQRRRVKPRRRGIPSVEPYSVLPPKYRRRRRPYRLKVGNLFTLVAGLLAVGWMITLPLRWGHSSAPPIITPQPFLPTPVVPKSQPPQGFVYNISTPPQQVYSQELQAIVDQAVHLARTQGFSTDSLSITLINVRNAKTHTFAGYQNQTPRFPASVAKLFWMAAFYAAANQGLIQNPQAYQTDLEQMIKISDNDGASRIVDAITDTTSGEKLQGEALKTWRQKRSKINTFFQAAGYEGIQLSTKNYPIYYLHQTEPTGRDLQTGEQPETFLRNQVTTDQAARLLYEIYTRQSVSAKDSTRMAYLLTRNLNPKVWKNDPINPIKGFLGESLPPNLYLGAKVGYTSVSRQEAAFIRTPDDKAMYILVVFADDEAYAKNETIFPALSRLIFDRMIALDSKK